MNKKNNLFYNFIYELKLMKYNYSNYNVKNKNFELIINVISLYYNNELKKIISDYKDNFDKQNPNKCDLIIDYKKIEEIYNNIDKKSIIKTKK